MRETFVSAELSLSRFPACARLPPIVWEVSNEQPHLSKNHWRPNLRRLWRERAHLKLFRVNAGVPIQEALEHAAHVLYYAKMLSLEAAMDPRAEKFAFASHYLCDMGKAIIDDLLLALQPDSPTPQ